MRKIKVCSLCRLHKWRTNAVPGEGNQRSSIVFVGEAPGFSEDKQGRPFVGAAGRFLNSLLEISGLKREEVFITNVVKCRPPENRDPMEDEIKICTSSYLKPQFQFIRPQLVVALGRIAGGELLGEHVVVGREHGKLSECTYGGVRFNLFITYHPAAALYGADAREKLIEDFKKLKKTIENSV